MIKFLVKVCTVVAVSGVLLTSAWAQPLKLTWQEPLTNEDGTPLTDLVGYKMYEVKTVEGVPVYTKVGDNILKGTETAQITAPEGTHCYVVTAYDDATVPNESQFSNVACGLVVDDIAPATVVLEIVAE